MRITTIHKFYAVPCTLVDKKAKSEDVFISVFPPDHFLKGPWSPNDLIIPFPMSSPAASCVIELLQNMYSSALGDLLQELLAEDESRYASAVERLIKDL